MEGLEPGQTSSEALHATAHRLKHRSMPAVLHIAAEMHAVERTSTWPLQGRCGVRRERCEVATDGDTVGTLGNACRGTILMQHHYLSNEEVRSQRPGKRAIYRTVMKYVGLMKRTYVAECSANAYSTYPR